MEKQYTIIDGDGEPSGSLRLSICETHAALDEVMGFSQLEVHAAAQNHPSPSSCGWQHFREQLPITQIHPVAVLEDVEINAGKRRRGLGRRAVRGFRAAAEEYGSRLGLLCMGTQGDEYEEGLQWRRRFYESESWISFNAPPLPGYVLVWMYHLLPPLSVADRGARHCLVEDKPKDQCSRCDVADRSDGLA